MSDFWNTSTGESAVTEATTSFDAGTGNDFEPIPAGTKVLAMPEAAKWRTVKDSVEEYVEITWVILKPEAYQNRKIFHKLWVRDLDPNAKDTDKAKAKKDKHLKLLAAIDANAGGRLAKLNAAPSDDNLSVALLNKPMVIGLGTWDDAETKKPKGNWVMSVAPKGSEISTAVKSEHKKTLSEDLGEDLPF